MKTIRILLATLALPCVVSAQNVTVHVPRHFLTPPSDEARDTFNAGQRLYDEDNFAEAERKFREVIQRFPRHPIADRADYYLIRTLTQLGKRSEALSRVNAFARTYPRSRWVTDVEEMKIRLTNQVPAAAEKVLLQVPPPPPPPRPIAATPAAAPAPPRPIVIRQRNRDAADPEITLQQEMMRAMFRSDADRAIVIATERLKSNIADPVVISALNMVAASASAQALPMLLEIAKNSPNAKARKDAIFWMSQSRVDKDAVVDSLLSLSSSNGDDSDSINFALSQIRTEKAVGALATIARDKGKPEPTRENALFWIGQSGMPNRLAMLEDIYKNSMDSSQIRNQVLFALSRTREPQAATILGNVASTDPDIDVRKQAAFWLGHMRIPEATQTLENLLRKK
jgi:hypothetical protein